MRVEFGDAYASKVMGRAEGPAVEKQEEEAVNEADDDFDDFKESFIQSGPHKMANLDDR
jgi:hypothetical protein